MFFDAFKKQTPTDQVRKILADNFDKIAKDAIRDAAGDPVVGGMIVEMSIGQMYQNLKQNS